MRGGWILLIAGIAGLSYAVYAVVTRKPDEQAGGGMPPMMVAVTLAQVERGEFRGRVQLTGSVRSRRSAELAFEIDGRIASLAVREGDRVEAGAVLAQLDGADERLALAWADSSLALAKSELAKLEAGARAEEKLRLEAELLEAQAMSQWSGSELERAKTLRDQDVGSQAQVERLESELRAAEARVAAKQAELDQARAGTRAEDLEVARAHVGVAEAMRASAEESLKQTQLRAPWPGAVARRVRSEGDHVEAGAVVVALVDLDRREIAVEVPPRWARELAPGARVRVTLDEAPKFALETVVSARAPAAEEASRNFRALVDVDASTDPEGVLAPGVFVRLDVDLTPIADAIIVPSDAVRITPEGTVVVRADPAPRAGPARDGAPSNGAPQHGPPAAPFVATWVPVRVLAVADGKSAVESTGAPLAAGESIVLTGVDMAFAGAPLLPRGASGGEAHAAPAPREKEGYSESPR